MKKVAIFASGSGSNAEEIIKRFQDASDVSIVRILSNKKDAFVLERAQKHGIATHVFTKADFSQTGSVGQVLKEDEVDFIVLAGFLWLFPLDLIQGYENRIVNIHPALLPKYGGKGMYGMRVHEQVVANKETETGITIHFVNEHYDEGEHILQATCSVAKTDSPEDVAKKIHALEYRHFPEVIESLLRKTT